MLHGHYCYTFASIYVPQIRSNVSRRPWRCWRNSWRAFWFWEETLILRKIQVWALPTDKPPLSFRALKYVKQLLRFLYLVDSWWVIHTRVKDYSSYSKTHSTYSCLDLFLVDQFYLKKHLFFHYWIYNYFRPLPYNLDLFSGLRRSLETDLAIEPVIIRW